MRYFTPDLLIRFGSEDDSVADKANEEWEGAIREYENSLRTIRRRLPRGAKAILANYSLHDAKVRMFAMPHDGLAFSMFLELDTPADTGVMLFYDLVKRADLLKHHRLAEKGTPVEWLYDEFGEVKWRGRRAFTHSILFTGGRELVLTFRRLRLTVFENVLVPVSEQAENDLEAMLAG